MPHLIAALAMEPNATPEHIVFICFNASVISALRQQLPAYRAYWLTSTTRNADGSLTLTASAAVTEARNCNASGIDIYASDEINAAYVNEVHAAGLSVHVWTVDDPGQATALAAMGVESISSNRAGDLAAHLSAPDGPLSRSC